MKNLKKVFVVVFTIMLLVGCGNEENKERVFDKELAKEKISALTFADNNFKFTENDNIDNVDALKVYGVDITLFKDYLFYISNNITDPSMYLIVKIDDNNKSVARFQIKEMFEKYYNSYNNYYPKEAKMIKDRIEEEYEGYSIYVVSYNNNSVYQAIKDSFK